MTQPVTCRTCEQQLGSAALIAQLRSRVVELETVGQAEVRELIGEREKFRAERDEERRLRRELKEIAKSGFDDMSAFADVKIKECDQLRTRLQQAEAEREGARGEALYYRDAAANLTETIESLRTQLATAQRERDGLQAENLALKNEIDGLRGYM